MTLLGIMNGYSGLAMLGLLLGVVAMAVEYRLSGTVWIGIGLGVLAAVGLVLSMVQATRDENVEKAGWWWSDEDRGSAGRTEE
jgi:uncharacterized membrane protein